MPDPGSAVRTANEARVFERRVFFSGSGALGVGIGLCFDRVRSTNVSPLLLLAAATAYAEQRDNVVALPATANRGDFAGVTAVSYPAVSGGQWITIYEPGSVCPVAIDVATVINQTMVTCQVNADPGVFGRRGLEGRGSAIALQTTLTATATSGPGPNVNELAGSATFTLATRNVNKTGLFANAIAGDFLVVYGGAVAADGTAPLTPGVYTILTVTDANNAIMAVGTTMGTAAAVTTLNGQVLRGAPTVLARLLDGPESGCVDYIEPLSLGAPVLDINGYTYVTSGGVTWASNAVPTLAAHTVVGRRRGFEQLGGVSTTGGFVVTGTGILADSTGAVKNSVKIGLATQLSAVLEWSGQAWCNARNTGGVFA